MPIEPLPASDLAWRCDDALAGAATTAELADLEHILGQDRAVEALQLALAVRRHG